MYVKSYDVVIQNGLDFQFEYAGGQDLDFMVIDHHRHMLMDKTTIKWTGKI